MHSICEQFTQQKDSVYFYADETGHKVPNYTYLKTHPNAVRVGSDPFLNPRLFSKAEFRPAYLQAQARMEALFLATQAAVIKVVDKKRNSLSADDFKNLIVRLQTVRLADPDEPEMRSIARQACNRPNAIYMSDKHALFVCPSLMNFPDMTLQKVIAHELGHVIDPCTLSYELNSIAGIPYQKNPLQQTVQCLQSKDSIESYGSYDQKHRDQHGACARINPQDQIEEVFADWVASEVVAEKVRQEQNHVIAEKKALESQLLFLSVACFADKDRETHLAKSHPSIQKRVERIFLAQSAFQQAFSCQSPDVKHCD
jgi:hypothetical protein